MTIKKQLLATIFSTGLVATTLIPTSQAAPWVDTGDARLRHHIQVLADSGIISSPITTWPLMWASIAEDISKANVKNLSAELHWSLSHVRFAYQEQTASTQIKGELTTSNSINPLTTFGNKQREQHSASASIDSVGERFAGRLSASYQPDSLDDNDARLDGSYLAAIIGNWAFSIGAVDRWWGPGWNNSLILSHNARPVPGIALQRNRTDAFETPWLSWIGPWQLQAFAGQLESSRYVPDAKLIGMRFSLKPAANWEIGLSRSMQWGGEGRPQSLESLGNLLLGKDNRGSGGIAADGSNEPGNQLGGIDIRYNTTLGATQTAAYFQFIGEDEAGALPSRGIAQFGLESSFSYQDIQHRLILEYSNTTTKFYSDERPNTSYEHSIYQSGYRYYQRNLAASIESDSEELSLNGQHYFSEGQQLHWQIAAIKINKDGTTRNPDIGSLYQQPVNTGYLKVSYQQPISKHWMAEVGLHHSEKTLYFADETLDTGGYIKLGFKY